jgi:hypothetical protein
MARMRYTQNGDPLAVKALHAGNGTGTAMKRRKQNAVGSSFGSPSHHEAKS